MVKIFEPTLAITATPELLSFPRLASPKLDGIRAYVRNGKLYTRRGKLVPNRYTQSLFATPHLEGVDGELIVGAPYGKGVFQRTSSGVMTIKGKPQVRFWVFDNIGLPASPYAKRLESLNALVPTRVTVHGVVPIPHKLIRNQREADAFTAQCLKRGYEGSMMRDPDAPYHIGRCGKTTPYLLRIKPKVRCEVRIVGFEELKHNDNEAFTNELGRTRRSSAKAGKRGGNTLGKFVTEWKDANGKVWPLKVGTGQGMTQKFRKFVWENQSKFLRKWLSIEYQEVGMKDVPRSPSAVGIRDWRDFT